MIVAMAALASVVALDASAGEPDIFAPILTWEFGMLYNMWHVE